MDKRQEIRLDPLYRVIDEPEESQFVESIFNRQFSRLKDISNLGIIPEVFKMAKYSKYEHAFGTVHQIVNLLQVMEKEIPEYRQPLVFAALFFTSRTSPVYVLIRASAFDS